MQAQHIGFLQLLDGRVQYVIPRWQRRYSWGRSDIERLVADLLTIAEAGDDATHYGGTLLTLERLGAAGVLRTIRVVDGQQRLTTVSILLACIAARLERDGPSGEWNDAIIRERLTNPHMRQDQRLKLRLQAGDDAEYRRGLEGRPGGSGAVTQAWRIARRLVDRNDVAPLLTGLERLRVVSIGLQPSDDPQQIFESINATGRPLTESEKIKNWLLMGLPDAVQQDLHDNYWLDIERRLDARYTTEPVDIFLRDLLRWQSGEVHGVKQVYEAFRRWAVPQREDRAALCRRLAKWAGLYGIVTGTTGQHPDTHVERELRHLQALGVDVHRPLTLRLLDDYATGAFGAGAKELAATIGHVSSWITRMWLADRPLGGLNRAFTDLAHGPGPDANADSADCVAYWQDRIRRLRHTRVGVPGDEAVREGLSTRKAYGGSATPAATAVLCALMEAEHVDDAPARDTLTIEHVMPQKLTTAWRNELGDAATDVHGRYGDRLANLTLLGEVGNPSLGAAPFAEKRPVYRKSTIGMTRRLAALSDWNEEALERRASQLADQALSRWPWPAESEPMEDRSATCRWRIEAGAWRNERAASQMVLRVAAALLDRDPENADRLSGEAIASHVHPASRFLPDKEAGSLMMRAIPGHPETVLYPYGSYPEVRARCERFGERCGVGVEVEILADDWGSFWRLLKDETGGVPGQKETWAGSIQWTTPVNSYGDRVAFSLRDESLTLFVSAGSRQRSREWRARMREISRSICDHMVDQQLDGDVERRIEQGWSIAVVSQWARDDQTGWPDAAHWLKDQHDRLRVIAEAPSR